MNHTQTNSRNFEAINNAAYLAARKKLGAKYENELCEDIAQDVAAVMCTRSEADIQSPLAYAGTLAQHIANTHLRRKFTHRRFLERALIPSQSDFRDDPATEMSSLEQREQLRNMLLSLDVLDTLHLLALSLSVPAHEVRAALYNTADAAPSIATIYSHRHRAIERARNHITV